MEKVSVGQVKTRPSPDRESVVAESVQRTLGELAGAAREGLLALAVEVGLGVLEELLEEEVVELVGAKGRHDRERASYRHGHEDGQVTLGARRVSVRRPRVRSLDGSGEVAISTYRHFAARDALSDAVLERMLAGVSTRRYRRVQEPVGAELEAEAHAVSKSAVSRAFVARTREQLIELMGRRLEDVRLAALMIDGIVLKGRCCCVALGITTTGQKLALGLWDGSTENAAVATALLADLVDRGLDTAQGVLCVIDGSKALRRAIREVLGEVPVQRCIRHKERNVLDHLPESQRPAVRARLRAAWSEENPIKARDNLTALVTELQRGHPGAAASLREGLEETLTVTRLGLRGKLKRALASTNPIESMISTCRRTSRNVKNWSSGEMCLRWTAAGMLEAERQFRRIKGYDQLATLAVAVEHELAHNTTTPTTKETTTVTI